MEVVMEVMEMMVMMMVVVVVLLLLPAGAWRCWAVLGGADVLSRRGPSLLLLLDRATEKAAAPARLATVQRPR